MEELPDITTGISKPGLFEKFKLQLQKDFENCGLEGKFAVDLIAEYNLILNTVHLEVEKMNKLLHPVMFVFGRYYCHRKNAWRRNW
ncbi:MAG: hypothetical protein IPJ32_16700 [Sphingobacteriaceae bacterium]|nr:hypothetical protein [Sphingobacteriaceae bacterium]